jgi:hypothetical protein
MPMNSVCFDTMIKFYTDISTVYSIRKALRLLETLEKSDTVDFKPVPWHYTAVVKGLIHVKDVDTAAIVLRRAMERHFGNDSYHQQAPINTIPAMLHSVIMLYIKSNQFEKASEYIENYVTLQNSFQSHQDDPTTDHVFDVIPTLQALQTAWKDTNASHPDMYHHIDRLDQHIHTIRLSLKAPSQPVTVSLTIPQHFELLPPLPPMHNFEVLPTVGDV